MGKTKSKYEPIKLREDLDLDDRPENWLENATLEELIADGLPRGLAESVYNAMQDLKNGDYTVITDYKKYIEDLKKEFLD